MRLIKMFSLTVVAAIAAMAITGASSASASGSTALCKANELTCAAGNVYTGHVEALGTSLELLGVLDVKCNHSKVLGEVLGLANPLIGHVSELTFTGCTCTVDVKDKTGLVYGLKTEPNIGVALANEFIVLVQCGFVDCLFGGSGFTFAEGGNPARVIAVEDELEKLPGGFLCGDAGFFDATYTIVLPKPIYIAA